MIDPVRFPFAVAEVVIVVAAAAVVVGDQLQKLFPVLV